jgi:hypothetical protein
VAIICLAVALPPGIYAEHWLSGSSTGTASVGHPTGTIAQHQEPVMVTTSLFSTLLPAGFHIKRQLETPNGNLHQLELVAYGGTNLGLQFAATVGVVPSDGLQGIGDYNLRTTQRASYSLVTPVSLPAGAHAFQSTTGPASLTVFWPHGNRYVELAFTTDSGASYSQLEAVYAEVLANWSWQ